MSEKEKNSSKDFPTRKDWGRLILKLLYIGTLIIIVASAFWRIYNIPTHETTNFVQNVQQTAEVGNKKDNTGTTNVNQQKEIINKDKPKTLTEVIIVPMANSPKFKIIFEHLFYAFLLFIFVILIPLPLERMKRFKLFNFELEMDAKEKEMVNTLEAQQDKFNFLVYLSKEENKRIFMIKERNYNTYRGFLLEMLENMKNHYKDEWNAYIQYEVLTEKEFKKRKFKLPNIVRKTLDKAKKEYDFGVPINKENEFDIHFKNYLIYPIEEMENIYTTKQKEETYVIVLSSYRYFFDESDGQLVAGMASLASDLYRRKQLLGFFIENIKKN
jgi:hypothetical protein